MESIRDIKRRMLSVGETLKITKAMNLIATSKLRRARTLREAATPYFTKVREVMSDLVSGTEALDVPYFDKRVQKTERKKAAIIITSDKGLAGGFNTNIIHLTEEKFTEGTFLLMMGQVGKRHFIHSKYPILEDFHFSKKMPMVYEAEEVASFVLSQFLNGTIDEVSIIFTRMHSSVKLEPMVIPLLPLEHEVFKTEKEHKILHANLEPSAEEVFHALVPKFLKGVIYGALVESYASEQSARMQAMDSASKNAEDMLLTMTLAYNRVRQGAITQEVSEIVSGAEALK